MHSLQSAEPDPGQRSVALLFSVLQILLLAGLLLINVGMGLLAGGETFGSTIETLLSLQFFAIAGGLAAIPIASANFMKWRKGGLRTQVFLYASLTLGANYVLGLVIDQMGDGNHPVGVLRIVPAIILAVAISAAIARSDVDLSAEFSPTVTEPQSFQSFLGSTLATFILLLANVAMGVSAPASEVFARSIHPVILVVGVLAALTYSSISTLISGVYRAMNFGGDRDNPVQQYLNVAQIMALIAAIPAAVWLALAQGRDEYDKGLRG